MKRLLLPAIALCFGGHFCFAGNWFGPSPWANATYYPGNLDGKYQAAVTGVNTTGVLGFAIRDGAPPFLQIESQSLSANALVADTVAVNQDIQLDQSLNYFAIFVNGRSYVGETAAGINYDNSTVTGTLIGTAPSSLSNTTTQITSQLFTNVSTTNIVTTNVTVTNTGGLPVTNTTIVTNTAVISNVETLSITNELPSPVLIATGVDGSFQANVNSKRGVFTFQGPGQLSSPGTGDCRPASQPDHSLQRQRHPGVLLLTSHLSKSESPAGCGRTVTAVTGRKSSGSHRRPH
jgi:hypothetical protein